MSGVGIDDFGASFIYYLPGVIETLNNTTYARTLPMGEVKWEGTHIEKSVHVRRNVAFTFTEDGGNVPVAGKQGYVPSMAYRCFGAGAVKVTEGILDNASTTRNAARTVIESELRGLLDFIRKFENGVFTRDGTGVVATLGATVSDIAAPFNITVNDARMMTEGANFEIRSAAVPATILGTFQVSGVSRAFTAGGEATLTLAGALPAAGQALGDLIVWRGTGGPADSMYGRAPNGLDALVDDGVGTFQNVNVTLYNRWTSPVFSNAGVARPLTTSLLRQLLATVKAEGGEPDAGKWTLLTNVWEGVAFEEMFEGEVRLTASDSVGGVEIASFQSTVGKVDVVTDPDSPYGKLFLLDMAQISRAVQHELDWRKQEGGGIFQTLPNSLNKVATCMETYEYFIEQRNKCGKIEDLREVRGTALG